MRVYISNGDLVVNKKISASNKATSEGVVAINKGACISCDLQGSICLFRRFVYQPSEIENSSYVVESYSLRLLISSLAKGIAVDRSAVVSLQMRSRVVYRARLSLPSVEPVANTRWVGSVLEGSLHKIYSESMAQKTSFLIGQKIYFLILVFFERYSGIGCAEPDDIKVCFGPMSCGCRREHFRLT